MDFKKIFQFLADLQSNNNRAWFNDNKNCYLEAKASFDAYIEQLIVALKTIDSNIDVTEAKQCTFRIYRDVRFSKNKAPYKENFGAYIAQGGRKSPYAGYYFHIEPDQSFAGGGIYHPDNKLLKVIRQDIFDNIDEFKNIINNQTFQKYFNGVYGEKLKMSPKGFDKTFKDIDLLKHKDYAVIHKLPNNFFFQDNFMDKLLDIYKEQYHFNAFLNNAVNKV